MSYLNDLISHKLLFTFSIYLQIILLYNKQQLRNQAVLNEMPHYSLPNLFEQRSWHNFLFLLRFMIHSVCQWRCFLFLSPFCFYNTNSCKGLKDCMFWFSHFVHPCKVIYTETDSISPTACHKLIPLINLPKFLQFMTLKWSTMAGMHV